MYIESNLFFSVSVLIQKFVDYLDYCFRRLRNIQMLAGWVESLVLLAEHMSQADNKVLLLVKVNSFGNLVSCLHFSLVK